MTTTDLDLTSLHARFGGTLLTAADAEYDAARVLFNAMIDRRPAVIAQCASVADVRAAISFARRQGLELRVRGGGHGVAGSALCDGGLVVDLTAMTHVDVDPVARTATVAGGATMSHLDRACQPHGLMTTGGRVSTTGVGGFALGGGTGWFDRKYGLACDNLLGVELVTAGGSVVTADADNNSELFWALHGGGGNFGVATSFTFALHPLPDVTAALLIFRPDEGPGVATAYRDFMATAPDEVGGGFIYLTGPDEEFVPEDLVGSLTCLVLLTYAGPEAPARAAFEPMLGLGHLGEFLVEVPYAEFQCMLDDPPGHRNYWSAEHLVALPDEAVHVFCRRADDLVVPSPSQHVLFPGGGAVSRGPGDWPIPWRTAPWVVHPFGLWSDPADDDRGRQWVHDVRADMKPWSTGAVYLNFIGDEGPDRLVAGLGAENIRRLAAVKAEYDPDNLFRGNHNIAPVRG